MGFKIVTYALPLYQDEKDQIVKVPRQAKVELTAGKISEERAQEDYRITC
jgi:hypothetical protein